MSDHIRNALRTVTDEIFTRGQIARIASVFAADYVEHAALPPGWPTGTKALEQYVGMMREAFPDLRLTLEDVVVEGDRAVARVQAHGTNRGSLMGAPPTDRSATWSELHFCRFANGKIVEHWEGIDRLSMLQQLGLAPA